MLQDDEYYVSAISEQGDTRPEWQTSYCAGATRNAILAGLQAWIDQIEDDEESEGVPVLDLGADDELSIDVVIVARYRGGRRGSPYTIRRTIVVDTYDEDSAAAAGVGRPRG